MIHNYAADRLPVNYSDRSARVYTDSGRLEVRLCNVSKACVNSYKGFEIPNWEILGLDAQKDYNMLRHPDELEKAVSTFNMIPVIFNHPEFADTPDNPAEDKIGTTGSDAVFEYPYVKVTLSFWDAGAIAGIESGQYKELSSGYAYDADMTSGEFEGQHYDGIMRNIRANHVAQVRKGRVGSDVVVNDSINEEDERMKMNKDAISTAIKSAMPSVSDEEHAKLTSALLDLWSKHEGAEAEMMTGDEASKPEDKPSNKPEEKPMDEKPQVTGDSGMIQISKDSLNEMIIAATLEARAAERAELNAWQSAKNKVNPMFGDIAGDSAEEVFRNALKLKGIATDSIKEIAALETLVDVLAQSHTAQASQETTHIVSDSAPVDHEKINKLFGGK